MIILGYGYVLIPSSIIKKTKIHSLTSEHHTDPFNKTKTNTFTKQFQDLLNDKTKNTTEKIKIFLEEDYQSENNEEIILGMNETLTTTTTTTTTAIHHPTKKPKYQKRKPPHTMTSGIHIIFQPMQQSNAQSPTNKWFESTPSSSKKKSDNFEVLTNFSYRFTDIGGYDNIKIELTQCIDILINYSKYTKYNVRIPKGLILEGPPGNGKTLLAKAFAGECDIGFIAVSGSEFQDKYVGVGGARVRELFELAKQNTPCIIFIDEIDALGRSRSSKDGEGASAERDNTLNELLVALDGFKTIPGIFVIGATNRADLLDAALLRPGRIDKRIFIGLPDEKTRRAIVQIHVQGKPYNTTSMNIEQFVEYTSGCSGAQIENILNEAMLHALRRNVAQFELDDVEVVMNKLMVGWQPNEHEFTPDVIHKICIHEMGHAIVGHYSLHHAKVRKIVLNLSSPTSPGYTLFEHSKTSIYTRQGLFEHLAILLSGRLAEELFFGNDSVTNGALNDFEEALKLAHKMIVYYGMGTQLIYPSLSDTYKEKIDKEVIELIQSASTYAMSLLTTNQDKITRGAKLLEEEKLITLETLSSL